MTIKELYEVAKVEGKEDYTIVQWMDNSEGPYEVTEYEFDDDTKEVILY